MPVQLDPATPGLLDLLTERALPLLPTAPAAPASSVAARPEVEGDEAVPLAVARLRPADGRVVRRTWVEVEA
jgi:hypothetical protein